MNFARSILFLALLVEPSLGKESCHKECLDKKKAGEIPKNGMGACREECRKKRKECPVPYAISDQLRERCYDESNDCYNSQMQRLVADEIDECLECQRECHLESDFWGTRPYNDEERRKSLIYTQCLEQNCRPHDNMFFVEYKEVSGDDCPTHECYDEIEWDCDRLNNRKKRYYNLEKADEIYKSVLAQRNCCMFDRDSCMCPGGWLSNPLETRWKC